MGMTGAIAAMALGSLASAGASLMASGKSSGNDAAKEQEAAMAAAKAKEQKAAKEAETLASKRMAQRSALLGTSSTGVLGNASVSRAGLLSR